MAVISINYKRIAYRLYISRKKLGLTQEQLSVLLGQAYGNSDVSNMEHAKKGSGIYRLDKLEVYANVLNIDVKWLIFGDRLEEEMKKMHSYYPDRYQKLLDEVDKKDDWDKLYEKYGFENIENMDTFDENKIFNILLSALRLNAS